MASRLIAYWAAAYRSTVLQLFRLPFIVVKGYPTRPIGLSISSSSSIVTRLCRFSRQSSFLMAWNLSSRDVRGLKWASDLGVKPLFVVGHCISILRQETTLLLGMGVLLICSTK